LAALAACAAPGGASLTPTESAKASAATSDEPTASEETSPTEEMTATEEASIEAEATITGVLTADDIEGGCVSLAAEDGTSYEVIWPNGWTIDPQTMELTEPSGEVLATAGDRITVHGRVAPDMTSICQIGEIFEAVEVEIAE
jgi:hypothetical protein